MDRNKNKNKKVVIISAILLLFLVIFFVFQGARSSKSEQVHVEMDPEIEAELQKEIDAELHDHDSDSHVESDINTGGNEQNEGASHASESEGSTESVGTKLQSAGQGGSQVGESHKSGEIIKSPDKMKSAIIKGGSQTTNSKTAPAKADSSPAKKSSTSKGSSASKSKVALKSPPAPAKEATVFIPTKKAGLNKAATSGFSMPTKSQMPSRKNLGRAIAVQARPKDELDNAKPKAFLGNPEDIIMDGENKLDQLQE